MTFSKTKCKRWSFLRRASYLLLIPIVPRLIRFYFRFEVNGEEYISKFPEGKGVIFCVNHQSHLDGFIVVSAVIIPFGKRRFLGFLGSGKIMQETLLGRFTLLWGGIPIFRENPKPALDYASRSLLEGFAVLITPQGRRFHRTPFHDYFNLAEEGRTGVGRIILVTNGEIPVVPLYIRGAAEALKPGTIVPKFRSYISVSFGEPLYFNQYSRQGGWSESDPDFYPKAREITNKIMNSIRNQFLITEKHYLDFLKLKFGAEIEKISVSSKEEREFNKLLHKLARVPPKQIQELLESKGSKL
ncbi:MAG: lysophospholipid acyltransferase family protein [Candidatus Hodarchaeota archaeon]